MLRALICINTDMIDRLCMWNQGVANKQGQYRYLVWLESKRNAALEIGKRLPFQKEVWHNREEGWQVLVMKSLEVLQDKKVTKSKAAKNESGEKKNPKEKSKTFLKSGK